MQPFCCTEHARYLQRDLPPQGLGFPLAGLFVHAPSLWSLGGARGSAGFLLLYRVLNQGFQAFKGVFLVQLQGAKFLRLDDNQLTDVKRLEASSSPPDDHLIATNKNTNKDKKEKKVRRQKEDEDNFVLTPKTYGCENHGLKSSESIIGRIDFDSIRAKYCDD